MTMKQLERIKDDWGRFLEITNGNLSEVFLFPLPECFLPYPKETIRKAMETLAEMYSLQGSEEGAEIVRRTIPLLEMYQDNEEVLEKFAERLKDKKYLKTIKSRFNDTQQKHLEYVLKYF